MNDNQKDLCKTCQGTGEWASFDLSNRCQPCGGTGLNKHPVITAPAKDPEVTAYESYSRVILRRAHK